MTRLPRLSFALLLVSLCAPALLAQGTFPLPAGTRLVRGQKYTSASGGHYLIQQNDGNLVVYTSANGFVWGLNLTQAPYARTVTIGLDADGNLTGRGYGGRLLWSALAAGRDPLSRLDLSASGQLQLVSNALGVQWTTPSAPIVLPPSDANQFAALQTGLQGCRTGLQALADNAYRAPENPAVAPSGRRAWNDVFSTFRQTSVPECDRVGAVLATFAGEAMLANVQAAFARNGMANWAAYFSGPGGIVTQGQRISTECPANAANCADATTRVGNVVAAAQRVLSLLAQLECIPEPGWAHCRMMANPSIKILGTVATSQSAMKNVKMVYTQMMGNLEPAYPSSAFDGHVVYLTNAERWSEIADLPPVGTMMGFEADGTPKGDELRGGAGGNFLWITEMMICKTGVETRNQAYAEGRRATRDDVYRSFDQVIHEMGHNIDFKFNLRARINSFYAGGWNPVEQFPYSIQAWYGAPVQNMTSAEFAFMDELFKTRTTFSCAGYNPNEVTVGTETPVAPASDQLGASYPNPFSTRLTIPFTLAQPGHVTLKVYDVLGREVATLADGDFPAGRAEATWEAAQVPNGVYLYRLQTPGYTDVRAVTRAR